MYNVIIYFMANLRRDAGAFFTFQIFVRIFLLCLNNVSSLSFFIVIPRILDHAGILQEFRSFVLEFRFGVQAGDFLRP